MHPIVILEYIKSFSIRNATHAQNRLAIKWISIKSFKDVEMKICNARTIDCMHLSFKCTSYKFRMKTVL